MFKRMLLTAVLILGLATGAQAITWHTANQATVGWDAPTTYENGNAIPTGTALEYEVFTATLADKSDKELVQRVSTVSAVLSFINEGNHLAGVRAVRTVSGTDLPSGIAWSDNPDVCKDAETFGISFYLIPDLPNNLYKQ